MICMHPTIESRLNNNIRGIRSSNRILIVFIQRTERHGRNGRMWPTIIHFSRLEDTLHVAREFKDPVEKPAVYAGKQAWVSHSSK